MSYDRSRVDFTDTEHAMAAAFDNLGEQFADGFQFSDIQAVLEASSAFKWLAADDDRNLTAQRGATIILMLERDNEWLTRRAATGVITGVE